MDEVFGQLSSCYSDMVTCNQVQNILVIQRIRGFLFSSDNCLLHKIHPFYIYSYFSIYEFFLFISSNLFNIFQTRAFNFLQIKMFFSFKQNILIRINILHQQILILFDLFFLILINFLQKALNALQNSFLIIIALTFPSHLLNNPLCNCNPIEHSLMANVPQSPTIRQRIIDIYFAVELSGRGPKTDETVQAAGQQQFLRKGKQLQPGQLLFVSLECNGQKFMTFGRTFQIVDLEFFLFFLVLEIFL